MMKFQILMALIWMLGFDVFAADTSGGAASNEIWRTDFMGQEYGVLPVERSFVPKVKICGGIGKNERLLSVLMTVIHYDAIGKRPPTGRLGYTNIAIAWDQVAKCAEWSKGELLSSAESEALQRVYSGFAGGCVCEIPIMKTGSTMFAGQAEVMKRHVFGRRFDLEEAIQNFEKKNGWKMDIEHYESLSFEMLSRAVNKHALPILMPRRERNGAKRMVIAIGAYSNAGGSYVLCASPVDCGLGQKSYFDKVTTSGPEWPLMLAPPGSAGWNMMQSQKKWMWPDELEVILFADLPKGCTVLSYDASEWDATVVKDMRPSWAILRREIEKTVITNACATNALAAAQPMVGAEDSSLWAKYFIDRESFAISNEVDLVAKVRICPVGDRISPFASAFAAVVFRTHPGGVKLVESGYEWLSVVHFTCEERWRLMAESDKKALISKFKILGCNMPSSMVVEYNNGELLWSVNADGEKQLRALFSAATNGVVLGPIKPVLGKTTYQQAVERLLPFDKVDPVKSAMARVADRYGWGATVEQMENPTFVALKKAIEMEIPVLVKKSGSGGWAVVVGFLADGGEQYVLMVEPEQVKPDPRGEDVSQEEHEGRMALRVDLPGRVKYVKSLEKSKFVVDRVLDTHRELPEGCHFVKMSSKPFATAYFIHDWKPTICSKEKVAELVARTKPVDGPDYKK